MAHFDLFNGDADGICALQQLRLVTSVDATLITGVKRDIALLDQVMAHAKAGDSVTVLDVSMDANRAALLALLDRGITVDYYDHHGSGEVPVHRHLHATIDRSPNTCTALLVDRVLNGAHRLWAIVGAFGDNLAPPAQHLAQQMALDASQVAVLCELGEAINYNAYGDDAGDLLLHPAQLYQRIHPYRDPFAFTDGEPVFAMLHDARMQDLALAEQVSALKRFAGGSVIVLPDAAWCRRVRGTLGNVLARREPAQAHAVLAPDSRHGYTVSVRAPLASMSGADRLCRMFVSGGGRPAAAGINHLPADQLGRFVQVFEHTFAHPSR